MKIHVHDVQGSSFTVDAKPAESVSDLFSRIAVVLGHDSGVEYDLLFAGKVLTETQSSCSSLLSDHGLRNNSTIQLAYAPIRIRVSYAGTTRDIAFNNSRDITVRDVKQLVRDAFPNELEFVSQLPALRKGDALLLQDDSSIIFDYKVASHDVLEAFKKVQRQSIQYSNSTDSMTTGSYTDSPRSSYYQPSQSSIPRDPLPAGSSVPSSTSPSSAPSFTSSSAPSSAPYSSAVSTASSSSYVPSLNPPSTSTTTTTTSQPQTTPRKDPVKLDLVFSFDTSGSLFSQDMDIRRFFSRLLKEIPELRIGMILHEDFLDYRSHAVAHLDLTNDLHKLTKFVQHATSSHACSLQAGAYALALREARFMSWGEGRRVVIVIGAGVPHPPSYTKPHLNWWEELDCLVNLGVKVYGVWNEQYEHAWPFYQEIAERTGSVAVKFNNVHILEDLLQAIVLREISKVKLAAFQGELQQIDNRGRGWQEEVGSLFLALSSPDFPISRGIPKELKSPSPWYNTTADTDGAVSYILDSDRGTWDTAVTSYFPSDTVPKMKFVLLGCRDVGKTFMLIRFANSYPHKGYYSAHAELDGKAYDLSLFDTERHIDTDNLYPLEYPHTDMFIICFSLVSPPTMLNIEKWSNEIAQARIPFLLVGTKSDLRDVIPKGLPHVTTQRGQKFAKKIGAADYMECSAKTQAGIRDVFERAMTLAMANYEAKASKKRKGKMCLVM